MGTFTAADFELANVVSGKQPTKFLALALSLPVDTLCDLFGP